MPANSERSSRGGDVTGTCTTDAQWGVGKGVSVAGASFDPGYSLEESLPDTSKADLKQGYCSYGKSIGEGRKG